jgi:cellobiose phosphorylase
MYQLVLESFVGLKKEGDAISFSPCLPVEWPSIKVKYRYNGQLYDFEILQEIKGNETILKLLVNDVPQKGLTYLLEAEEVIETNINA